MKYILDFYPNSDMNNRFMIEDPTDPNDHFDVQYVVAKFNFYDKPYISYYLVRSTQWDIPEEALDDELYILCHSNERKTGETRDQFGHTLALMSWIDNKHLFNRIVDYLTKGEYTTAKPSVHYQYVGIIIPKEVL